MRSKKGFTLLELLFVMVLLAIMALIVYPKIVNKVNETKKSSFLTEAKTVIRESGNKYSTEMMKNNKIDFIGFDSNIKLDLTNTEIKYCVNVVDKGSVSYAKISNGTYYIEGSGDEIKSKTLSDVKYGNFSSFDCNYTFNEKDLLDDTPITFMSEETYSNVAKYLGIAFGVTLILSIFSRRTNSR